MSIYSGEMEAEASKCQKCGHRREERQFTVQWNPSDSTFRRLPRYIHSIRFDQGPYAQAEIQELGESASSLTGNIGFAGKRRYLCLGQTLELRCDREYEIRAQRDSLSQARNRPNAGAAVQVPKSGRFILDEVSPQQNPGVYNFFHRVTALNGDSTSTLVIHAPVRGLRAWSVLFDFTIAFTGGAAPGFSWSLGAGITHELEEGNDLFVTTRTAAMPNVTTSAERIAIYGEANRLEVVTPSIVYDAKIPGYWDFWELTCAVVGAPTGGTGDIFVFCKGFQP